MIAGVTELFIFYGTETSFGTQMRPARDVYSETHSVSRKGREGSVRLLGL